MNRMIRLHTTSRAGALAIGAGVLVIGGVLVVVGATLLLALGAVGAIAGTGILAYRKLTGSGQAPPPAPLGDARRPDPSLEVFPDGDPEVRRLPPSA